MGLYRSFGKRFVDVVAAGAGLLVTAPLVGVLALLVVGEDGGPPFLRQRRLGRRGESFFLFKLRSMPPDTRHVPAHQATGLEVTNVGKWMRRTSLDELPQLMNVLRGEMSLVGPRPSLPDQEELNRIREELGVWAVLPGMTGLAQVKHRGGTTERQKAEYDAEYVRSLSLSLDMQIILRTLKWIIRDRPPSAH